MGMIGSFHTPYNIPHNAEPSVIVENYNTQGNLTNEVFYHAPQRVVTFWQNSVETLLALGLRDRIVAAVGVPYPDCIKEEYRADYEAIPIKQMQPLDTENILMLRPDFILGWASTFTQRYIRTTEFWNSRNVNTYIAPTSMRSQKQKTIEDEYKYILDMGNIFGREEKAHAIVANMKDEINYIQNNTAGREKPHAIIIEKQKDILKVYGKYTLAGNILERVNGRLIDTGVSINYEQLIEQNPDVIFLIVCEEDYVNAKSIAQQLYDNNALQDISAIKNHRIYTIPLFMVYSSAVRTYDGIKKMAEGLYPDLYYEVSQDE